MDGELLSWAGCCRHQHLEGMVRLAGHVTGLAPANLRSRRGRWLKRWLAAAGKKRQVYVQCARSVTAAGCRSLCSSHDRFGSVASASQLTQRLILSSCDLSVTRTVRAVSGGSRVAGCSALPQSESLRSCVSIKVTADLFGRSVRKKLKAALRGVCFVGGAQEHSNMTRQPVGNGDSIGACCQAQAQVTHKGMLA